MTEVSAAPSTKTIIIQGLEFTASLPYLAGHTLTDAEARALNQVRLENIRNNFATKVKASTDKAEGSIPPDQLSAKFAEFEAAYSFSMPGAGGGTRTLDPIEREALALAKDVVKNALAAQGKSMTAPKEASDDEKAAYKDKINAKVEEIAGRDVVIAQARKNVAARSKSLDALAEGLDL